MKFRIAVFMLTSCGGCQVEFLNLEDELLPYLDHVDVTHWLIAKEENDWDGPFDVAFVEGTPVTVEEIGLLRQIRQKSTHLVAMGSCATEGCMPGMVNRMRLGEAVKTVYGEDPPITSVPPRGISEYVNVDFELPGCPIFRNELVSLLQSLIHGKIFRLPEHSVCVDCSLQENGCVLERGIACMGPVTRGGCAAICIANGLPCMGCRGLHEDANVKDHVSTLREIGLSEEEVLELYVRFRAGIPAMMEEVHRYV